MPIIACIALAAPAHAERAYDPYDTYQGRFYQRLGAECIQRAGPAVQCFELLETSLEFDRRAPIVHFTLGKYYQALGDNEKAIGAFSRALELDPDLLPSLISLGDAYVAKGQYAQGRVYYERFMRLAPTEPVGPYSVGASYAAALDEESALAHLRRAIELGFTDAKSLREDPRWRNVVGSPELKRLLAGVEKNETAQGKSPKPQ